MKGINDNQKESRYISIREITRLKIIKSYQETLGVVTERGLLIGKCFFYEDLIDCLGKYESHYILLNLFLEPDFTAICIHLNKENTLLKYLISLDKTELSYLAYFLIDVLNKVFNNEKSENLVTSQLDFLIKSHFQRYIPLSKNSWNLNELNSLNDVSSIYAKRLIFDLSPHKIYWEKILFTHILYVKLWNFSPNFRPQRMAKNLLLKNELIKNYKTNTTTPIINIESFEQKLKTFRNTIFVKKIEFPLEFTNLSKLESIFLLKSNQFKEILDFKRKIDSMVFKLSYYELIKLLETLSNLLVKHKIYLEHALLFLEELENIENKFKIAEKELSATIGFFKNRLLLGNMKLLQNKHNNLMNRFSSCKKVNKSYYKSAESLFILYVKNKILLNEYASKEDLANIYKYSEHSYFGLLSKNILLEKFYLF